MNKILKIFLITVGIVIGLWIAGRLTNMLQLFSLPTISNYPTIKPGNRFFASNLITPKRFDFICYYLTTPEYGKQVWVHRLCGLEGDTIEIRKGELLVNNKHADRNLSLAHNFIFATSELEKIRTVVKMDESFLHYMSPDSILTYLPDKTVSQHSIKATKQILPKDYTDDFIMKEYSAPWNQDNFGPVIVPKEKYFLLGDNRANSKDSRYNGFIDKINYVATVLGR